MIIYNDVGRSNARKLFSAIRGYLVFALTLPLVQTSVWATTDPANGVDGTNACNTPAAACPCGEECPDMGDTDDGAEQPTVLRDPINLTLNSTIERSLDLRLPGPTIGWSHFRTYDSRLARGGHGEPNSAFYSLEGTRTHGGGLGRYLRYFTPNSPNTSVVQLFIDATSHRVFTNSNTVAANSPVYHGPVDSPLHMTRTGSDDTEEFVVYNHRTGRIWIFYGINDSITENLRGMIKEDTTHALMAASKSGATYSYTSFGMVDWVLTSQGWKVDYSYYTSGTNEDSLKEINVYNGPSTSDTLLQKVAYTYFDSSTMNSDVGGDGDLVQVKVSRKATGDTNNNLSITRMTQYRYYTTSVNAKQVKMVLEADAIERILAAKTGWSASTILSKPDSETVKTIGSTDYDIGDFASRSFTYYTEPFLPSPTTWDPQGEDLLAKYSDSSNNSSHRAMQYQRDSYWGGATKSEKVNGNCASCGSDSSGGIERKYYYFQLTSWYGYGLVTDPNQVVRVVIEDTFDADNAEKYRRLYGVNYRGVAIRKALLTDPANPSEHNIWCESLKMNDDWRVTERRMPSAHKGQVTDNDDLKQFLDPTTGTNDADTVNASSGLVYYYEYDSNKKQKSVRVANGVKAVASTDFVSATEWSNHATGGKVNYLRDETYVYPTQTADRAATDRIVTTYAYTFWDDTDKTVVKTITKTLPAVSSGQNGSGVSTKTYQYFDQEGRLRWEKDGEGYVNYYSYHPDTGGLAYQEIDVNTDSLNSEITGTGSGKWVAWSDTVPPKALPDYDFNRGDGGGSGGGLPTALALDTQTEFDDQGRSVKATGPGGDIHETLYFAEGTMRLPYVDGSGNPRLPAQINKTNNAGVLEENFSVEPSTVDNADTGLPSTPSYVSRTKYSYHAVNGQREHIDRYYDADASSGGYYRTSYLYDTLGRLAATIQEVAASKYQVSAQLFDLQGRVIETRRGVASTAPTDYGDLIDDPIVTPAGFDGWATASKTEHDSGSVGDSLVSKTKRFFGTGADDYVGANSYYDWRNRLRGTQTFYMNGSTETAEGPHQIQDFDWRGNVVDSATYANGASITWTGSTGVEGDENYVASNSSGRNNWTKKTYDVLGRVYQTERYLAEEEENHFKINNYYDRNSRLVCTGDKFAVHTEYAFDGAGRQYQVRTVSDVEGTTHNSSTGAFNYRDPLPDPTLASMDGGNDGVIELSHTTYDDGGNAVERHTFEVNHDDTTSVGIDLTADDDYVRRTVFSWYDEADRLQYVDDYGSGDGLAASSTWEYSSLPSRSATMDAGDRWSVEKYTSGYVHGTDYSYNSAGRLETTATGVKEDTGGASDDTVRQVTKTYYDDLGRRNFVVENYDDFVEGTPPTGLGGGTNHDEDRATGWEYNGLGQTIKLTAYNKSTSTNNQVTDYFYEDKYNASLVTHTIYPDAIARTPQTTWATSANQVRREYHVDGSLKRMKDQRDTEHTYRYANRRQLEHDDVTVLGSGVDGDVRSISRTYDGMGRTETITSYDDISTGSPTPVNEIKYTYGSQHGQVQFAYQDHDGAVSGSEPKVEYLYDTSVQSYAYEDAARLLAVNYPNDARVAFPRGSNYQWQHSDTIDDRLSRITRVRFDPNGGTGPTKVDYLHNGVSRLVESKYGDPDVSLELFSRVGGTGAVTSGYAGWDRFGRTVKQKWFDPVASSTVEQTDYTYDYAGNRLTRDVTGASSRDQAYTYDGLHRLRSLDESTAANDRYWKLDQLGNWEALHHNTDGTSTAAQTRTHDDANVITQIDGSSTNLAHDIAGNMTKLPTVTGTAAYDELKFDAWNRLVEVKNNGSVVVANEFDGLNRRIVKTVGSDHYDYYYNQQWQVLETRKNNSANPWKQYVYHPQYVDSIAIRRFDDNTDGLNIDEHYYLQDANFNVTAVVDDTGNVDERYAYTPYGEVTFLDDSFVKRATQESDIDNEYLYTGRRLDPETGLQLNRNRFYASHLGRWVTRDPIGYRGGGYNLYDYVLGMPTKYVDPEGLESFYVCSRPNQAPGMQGDTARKCNCAHTGIYGDESGQVYDGWNGPPAGGPPKTGLPKGPGWKCKKLRKTKHVIFPPSGPYGSPTIFESSIKWGPPGVKGKSCKNATTADIQACLASKPARGPYPSFPGYLLENCQTDTADAGSGCCLGGFMPLTINPPGAIPY